MSRGVGRFCHMIKLIKYHVTKRPGRSPGAHIFVLDVPMLSLPSSMMDFVPCDR